jgi:hypothetical protein
MFLGLDLFAGIYAAKLRKTTGMKVKSFKGKEKS